MLPGFIHRYRNWLVHILLVCAAASTAIAGQLRFVTYNIEADVDGVTTPRAGMSTVLEGIGNENVNGIARPLDVLGLQETTSNTTTVTPMVSILNNLYGAGTYAMSPYQATQNGSPTSGNGPNAMVYNTTTLQLIASVGIGTPSSSGAPRQPVRYQFRPVGGTSAGDFYVYVSHFKSGTTTTDKNRRNVEAQMLRTNAQTLPATVRIIYMGDFNMTASTESAYVTLAASGTGQAFDPIDEPGTWEYDSSRMFIMTCSSTSLRYRADLHLLTNNIMYDPAGLLYIANSYRPFGNNGSVSLGMSVNSGSNTALPGLPNRSAVLSALASTSDHVPVVADYIISTNLPDITQQPTDQPTCAGTTVQFTVAATGTGTLSYRWQKDGTNLTDGGHCSGTATTTLTITGTDSSDVASYRCAVTDSNGTAYSNLAALTLKAATAITQNPMAASVCAGGSAQFTSRGSGDGTLSYQWQKNGTSLSDGGHYAGTATTTLTISSVNAADAASYDCIITAGCGSATSNSAALTLKTVTSISQHPTSTSVCTGGTAQFTVTGAGEGTVTYRWQKNSLNLSEGGHYSGVTTNTLTVSGADANDAAVYRCVVTGGCGGMTSLQATLTLKAATVVTQHPANQSIPAGGTAQFTTSATGNGLLSYQWQKNDINLSNGGHVSGATTNTLMITDADAGDAGSYQCIITAGCGSATSNAAGLTVTGPTCNTPKMDANGDLHVDAADFDIFSACYNGPTNPVAGDCLCMDTNGDQYVDATDFDTFSSCYNGPTDPPGCN